MHVAGSKEYAAGIDGRWQSADISHTAMSIGRLVRGSIQVFST